MSSRGCHRSDEPPTSRLALNIFHVGGAGLKIFFRIAKTPRKSTDKTALAAPGVRHSCTHTQLFLSHPPNNQKGLHRFLFRRFRRRPQGDQGPGESSIRAPPVPLHTRAHPCFWSRARTRTLTGDELNLFLFFPGMVKGKRTNDCAEAEPSGVPSLCRTHTRGPPLVTVHKPSHGHRALSTRISAWSLRARRRRPSLRSFSML